jgi:hypothetical protein
MVSTLKLRTPRDPFERERSPLQTLGKFLGWDFTVAVGIGIEELDAALADEPSQGRKKQRANDDISEEPLGCRFFS